MPFPFQYICDLLQTLHDETHSKKRGKDSQKGLVEEWSIKHRKLLDAPSTDGAAVLSTLLPGNRPDRVYGIQVNRLQSIISRAMGLGMSRLKVLHEYALPGCDKDLADCVEDLLTKTVRTVSHSSICRQYIRFFYACLLTIDVAKSQANRRDNSRGNRCHSSSYCVWMQIQLK